MNTKIKSMLASYARSFISAGLAVYAMGETDWRALVASGLAAVVPVAIRAANPKDACFGLVADVAEVEIKKVAKKVSKKK
jgi:hypothetical protein